MKQPTNETRVGYKATCILEQQCKDALTCYWTAHEYAKFVELAVIYLDIKKYNLTFGDDET